MIEINGAYNSAKAFTDNLEDTASEQIELLCNQKFSKGIKIRIMPDVHAGAGCVIGFTANLGELVIPNIVGVDIGCGMLTVELKNTKIEFQKLDDVIREFVPSGKSVHIGRIKRYPELLNLKCYRSLKDTKRLERSIGTLGGGNHFIEIDADDDGNKYLVIHTGSRNLGKQVAEYYQNLAYEILSGKDKLFEEQEKLIAQYKAEGRRSELQTAIKELKKTFEAKTPNIPKQLCYLTGKYRDAYIHDMKICQEYANFNRITIAEIIIDKLLGKSLTNFEHFHTIHNYIDMESNIVRKGAVSAKSGEKLLIPINMRDGSLICIGKGNEDWNFSAPHGAGRLFSRMSAKNKFTVEEFESTMTGIFTTSISHKTLDECPMAYKDMSHIVNNIGPTAEIYKIIKPLYNYKAGE
ncbi:MAG TPA: RtcB family protein [Clostridiales bacterium]|nr:RtcB family protein [Clostridiales bacterium]